MRSRRSGRSDRTKHSCNKHFLWPCPCKFIIRSSRAGSFAERLDFSMADGHKTLWYYVRFWCGDICVILSWRRRRHVQQSSFVLSNTGSYRVWWSTWRRLYRFDVCARMHGDCARHHRWPWVLVRNFWRRSTIFRGMRVDTSARFLCFPLRVRVQKERALSLFWSSASLYVSMKDNSVGKLLPWFTNEKHSVFKRFTYIEAGILKVPHELYHCGIFWIFCVTVLLSSLVRPENSRTRKQMISRCAWRVEVCSWLRLAAWHTWCFVGVSVTRSLKIHALQ